MPFTLAHPAAVLPLRRLPLMRTVPLIIGAMTPDVPYFLPWRLAKHIPQGATHSLPGLLTLDLPFGVLILLFMWLLRSPLAAPLGPASQAKSLAALERFGRRPTNWMLAPLSLLVGSWTHLAWDSFTHPEGWMVSRISALSAPVSFFSYTGEMCHVLQYASSIFGLAVLAAWFALLPRGSCESRGAERRLGGPLLLTVLLGLAMVVGGLETMQDLAGHALTDYHFFYLLLTRTTAWFALLYTVAGSLIVARGRRRDPAAAAG